MSATGKSKQNPNKSSYIFTGSKIWKFGIKNVDFRYNHYSRSDGLNANIVSFGIKFVLDK